MADINMFGPGGEDLAGLFAGQQFGQEQAAKEAATQNTLAQMANQQALTRGHELENQMTESLMPDKIAAYRLEQKNAAEDRSAKKQQALAEQMGQMGELLRGVPGPARPAKLISIAAQYGVAPDNPVLEHLSSIDPEKLPDALAEYSKKMYAATPGALGAANKEQAAMAREELQRRTQKEIAQGNNATALQVANIGANARLGAAQARGGGKGGSVMDMVAAGKFTPEKVIAYYEMKDATEGLTDEEQVANERLKRFVLNKSTVGRPDTATSVMGLPGGQERVEAAVRGETKAPAKKQQFEEGKLYRDANGNTAKYVGGKWVPQ